MSDEDNTDDEPIFYVMGEPVHVRGFCFEPAEARNGGSYIKTRPVVQFQEEKKTTVLDSTSQIKVAGGLGTLMNYARKYNMLPDWVIDNETPPWERDDE